MGSEYIQPAFDNINFVGRIDYSAIGPTWFAEPQEGDQTRTLFTPFGFGLAGWSLAKRETFGLINVRLGFPSESWGAFVVVTNLMDENYLEEVIPAPEFGGSFIHPGAEREWGVEVSYQF